MGRQVCQKESKFHTTEENLLREREEGNGAEEFKEGR